MLDGVSIGGVEIGEVFVRGMAYGFDVFAFRGFLRHDCYMTDRI